MPLQRQLFAQNEIIRSQEKSIDDLEHLADSDMYDQKKKYYEEHGITPRNH